MYTYFQKVEEVLSQFSGDCRHNYDLNKKTLKVNFQTPIMDKLYGTYDNEENEIELYKEDALLHELFHMSFRAPSKVNQKIYEDEDIMYSNGIAFSFICNDKKVVYGKGIVEGFVEYLFRKIENNDKKSFQYFFVDLLISIYGEDILEYAFKNDPVGFYSDKRFVDIHKFSRGLDELYSAQQVIKLITQFRSAYENIFDNGTLEEKQECSKLIFEIRYNIKNAIIEMFKLIINEFENCKESKICYMDFYNKLGEFFVDEDYSFIFYLDDNYLSMKDELEKIIKTFKSKNVFIRKINRVLKKKC